LCSWSRCFVRLCSSIELPVLSYNSPSYVAVIETVFDARNSSLAYIAAIATKPGLRRQGIGTTVLQQILGRHREQGITEHIALVDLTNEAARRCVEVSASCERQPSQMNMAMLSFDIAGNQH
jgi:GNAT superfamily N-acetyltransferase